MIEFFFVPPKHALFRPELEKKLGCILQRMLRIKGDWSVGVRFVSRSEIQRLNRIYRHKKTATDVLSFSAEKIPGAKERIAGDIVICVSYAKKEAKRRGIDPDEEVIRLVVHGVMHLFGWDHIRPKDEEKMFALQEKIVYEFT